MRIALISGGSAGMGRDFARELAAEGLDALWVIGRRAERLAELGEELADRLPVRAFALDLTAPDAFTVLKGALVEEKPEIAYLVAAAGVGVIGGFAESDPARLHSTVTLNCVALTDLISLALPYMRTGSRIITLASAAAYLPQPYFAVYAATKSYVLHLSRALAAELKTRHISVTAVAPGPVRTEFFATAAQNGVGMPRKKEKYMADSRTVVRRALRAARRGKKVCTPTLAMKLARLAAKILPHAWLMPMFRQK